MLLTILLCVVLIGLDQLAKYLVVQWLMPLGSYPAIPGVFEWHYIENNGAAFNLLAGRQPILIIVTGIALAVVAWLLLFRRPKDKLEYVALVLIFSGGVGNLIDRIAQGYVVDYINLLFMNFAVFNLADIFVCVGFALLFIAVIRSEWMAKKKKEAMAKKTVETQGETVAAEPSQPGDGDLFEPKTLGDNAPDEEPHSHGSD